MSKALTDVPSKAGTWMSWGLIAAAAVLAGVLLPQMMNAEMAAETPRAKAEAKDKGSLEYAAPALPEAPSASAMLARLGVGTVLVLGLCVATIFGMKRWMQPQFAGSTAPREMKLVETLSLGNRCLVHLVHLGKQPVLVGVDASGVKMIVPVAGDFENVLAEASDAQGPGTAAPGLS